MERTQKTDQVYPDVLLTKRKAAKEGTMSQKITGE
jgi:hypothetical protein